MSTHLSATTGGGPIGGPTSADGVGLRAVDAIRWDAPRGTAQETRLPDLTGIVGRRIEAGQRLRYATWPELDEDLSYAATHLALDLELEDGTTLLATGARDQYGAPADARGRGLARLTYPRQWNDVSVDLAPCAGRTIRAVRAVVDAPGEGTTGGWIDPPLLEDAPAVPDVLDPATDLAALVDTRRGTNASGDFSRGNTLPITAWPNGFAFFTPATNARSNRWPYEYHRANDGQNRPRLQGIGISHAPSPWMGDRNQLFLMPVSAAEPIGDPAARAVPFDHARETARPDLYAVDLADGTGIELAPTDHGAILRVRFPSSAAGRHLVIEGIDEQCGFRCENGELTGWVDNGPDGEGRTRMFVAAQIDPSPLTAGGAVVDPAAGGLENAIALTFTADEVTVRLATSFISVDQARRTLDLELARRTPAEIRDAARAAWNERLGVVRVQGATLPQLRTLYGCLYRLHLYPNSQAENAGDLEAPRWVHASPVLPVRGEASETATNAQLVEGRLHVNNGFWDTYRTAWPAYALLAPRLAAELADGFVQQHREGGWIARWSSPGYADLMTGTSSDVAFADLHARGVDLPDPLGTYDAGLRNATVVPERPAVGRKGLATSLYTGYVATDVDESVSWALEGYLNDFGLAGMAERLAADPATPEARRAELEDEAAYLRRRSTGYVHLFDPAVGFFQGRRPDGAFAQSPESFDPLAWGGDFTETDGWNFCVHVPHDGEGLATLHGGRAALAAKLQELFDTPETGLAVGGYGGVIHEMTEARDVRMGQFGFSNQPAHHIPFIHNHAGVPHRTQEVTREVLQRLFTGEEIGQGYPGDEDNGEMSAWYVLAALGLYPLRMGTDEWALTAPLFERAEVRPLGGTPFTILADGQSPTTVHVHGLEVDGRERTRAVLTQEELRGTIRFRLAAEPSDWAAGDEDAPPSLTAPGVMPSPWRDLVPRDSGTHPELTDDDARTEAAFGAAPRAQEPVTIDVELPEPGSALLYTLTSGRAEGGDPAAWRLEGRTEAGWVVLDERVGQVFRWRRQLRPFGIARPAECTAYRLVVTAGQGPLVLAGLELLA